MTFDEWFATEFAEMFANTDTDPYQFESAARRAWEAVWSAQQEEQQQLQAEAEQIAHRVAQGIDAYVIRMIETYPQDLQNRIITELGTHYTFPDLKGVDTAVLDLSYSRDLRPEHIKKIYDSFEPKGVDIPDL